VTTRRCPVSLAASLAVVAALLVSMVAVANPATGASTPPPHDGGADGADRVAPAQAFTDVVFRPGADITRQATVAFLYRLTSHLTGDVQPPPPAVATFSDVGPDHPFFAAIEWAADAGIVDGYPDGTFRPAQPVTRQAEAAFLARLLDALVTVPAPPPAGYTDVAADHPFAHEIDAVTDAGLLTGFDDGTFRPAATLTRQAEAAVLSRTADHAGDQLAVPVWSPESCTVLTPTGRVTQCGTLTVPEDRRSPLGNQVELAVAVVHTSSATPQPEPVVYLGGGPGGTVMDSLRGRYRSVLGEQRDVVMFDQRGIGLSAPNLECPERDAQMFANFTTADDFATERDRLITAADACWNRLVGDGIDLTAYNTIQNARDVRDLRRALGYLTWNVYGVSYGTALGQEVMRADADGVRAIIHDSVYPIDDVRFDRVAEAADRAIAALAAGCAADADCGPAMPDLEATLADVIADYDADPQDVTITNPYTSLPETMSITGADVVGGLFGAMYRTEIIPLLPSLLAFIADRNLALLQEIAVEAVDSLGGLTDGMFLSVECHDRGHGADEVTDLIAARPDLGTIYLGEVHGVCDQWPVPAAPPDFNELVTSPIPALVLAGSYDPITPPSGGQRVADALENATFVELPQVGHGVTGSGSACSTTIIRAFLVDPTATLDIACVALESPPDFVAP
jgi:pimeloyl-ACP methyl ester carboxylesterase